MKSTFKAFILSLFLSFISLQGFAQLNIAYYSSSSFLDKIGVGYNFGERIWGEFRLYGNTFSEDFTPELVAGYHVINKERYRVYLGAGVIFNIFSGVVVPTGVQFTPIEQFDNFSLHVEFQPILDTENDQGIFLQTSWGLRYRFGKKE